MKRKWRNLRNRRRSRQKYENGENRAIIENRSLILPPASAGILFGLLFDPEEEDDMLIRNVGLDVATHRTELSIVTATFS
jgi:hypothetical protein